MFKNKVSLEESHAIYLCTVYGCFPPATAELCTVKRDCVSLQMLQICYLAHYRKSLPTPDLGHCLLKGKVYFPTLTIMV